MSAANSSLRGFANIEHAFLANAEAVAVASASRRAYHDHPTVWRRRSGIGEHDTTLRAQVCAGLGYLGVQLDQALNLQASGEAVMAVHRAGSPVQVWVVPTDEGRVAAREAARLIASD